SRCSTRTRCERRYPESTDPAHQTRGGRCDESEASDLGGQRQPAIGRLILGRDEVEGLGLADVDQAVCVADTLCHVISPAFLEVIRPWPKHDLLLSFFGIGH